MRRTNLISPALLAASVAALALGCAEMDLTDEADGIDNENEIIELADLEGPEIDELRKSIEVPVTVVNVHEDGTLSIESAEQTAPGVPDINDEILDLGLIDEKGDQLEADHALDRDIAPDKELLNPEPTTNRTVFGTDERYAFHDHNYPYRTVGRVDTAGGYCSGTMVGPRHLLTASHCIVWNANGSMGWLRFRPSLDPSHSPYGEAWATRYYVYKKVGGPLLSANDQAFDFVVVVLDRYIGYNVGWMGSTTYDLFWNFFPYWANVGYPSDFGGTQPTFQRGCSVFFALMQWHNAYWSYQMYSQCDIVPGQSGSPLYGSFNGSPLVVGVTSAESSVSNYFAGGSLIPSLISQARASFP